MFIQYKHLLFSIISSDQVALLNKQSVHDGKDQVHSDKAKFYILKTDANRSTGCHDILSKRLLVPLLHKDGLSGHTILTKHGTFSLTYL